MQAAPIIDYSVWIKTRPKQVQLRNANARQICAHKVQVQHVKIRHVKIQQAEAAREARKG
jgi:hypothetical protein